MNCCVDFASVEARDLTKLQLILCNWMNLVVEKRWSANTPNYGTAFEFECTFIDFTLPWWTGGYFSLCTSATIEECSSGKFSRAKSHHFQAASTIALPHTYSSFVMQPRLFTFVKASRGSGSWTQTTSSVQKISYRGLCYRKYKQKFSTSAVFRLFSQSTKRGAQSTEKERRKNNSRVSLQ